MFYGLVINSPEAIEGDYEAVPASFGLQLQVALRRAWLVYGGATDKDIKRLKREKCEGKIVMFDRGQLDFTIMAACFQNLAAIGLIVINNTHGPAVQMTCDDDDPVADSILIPCYMISKGDGMNIRKVLDRQPVDVSLVTEVADVYSWGNGACGQLGLPQPRMFQSYMTPQMVVRHQSVRSIACGGTFSAVLLDTGHVFTWGDSEFGQLGHGSFVDRIALPRKVETFPADAPRIIDVTCGYFHIIVATITGRMYGWGWNEFGNLALGHRDNQASPVPITHMGDKKVRALAAGYFHTLCLCVNFRKPPAMTKEQMNEIGKEEQTRRRRDRRYKKSAEGKAANKAAGKRRGSVLSKLITRKSRMGGQSTMGSKGSKKKRGSKSSISASMLGWKPKYVPKAEDEIRTVYSWGDGEHGQLGHGESYTKEYISKQTKSMPGVKAHALVREYTALTTPRIVDALVGMRVVEVAAGGTSSAAVSGRGELLMWGKGLYGALGHGDELNQNAPTLVMALHQERIISVSLGQHHTCAITDRGDVYTWGKGEQGQLGQGEANLHVCCTPQRIAALNRRGACRAACASASTYVCTERGAVYVFGYNQGGRLGLGESNPDVDVDGVVANPMYMHTLDGAEVRSIVTGDAHVVVLTEYYHSDAVPARVDVGGPLLDIDEIFTPEVSSCCTIS